MDLGLADRVYILTGASKGLGFATAEALTADGARVVIAARTQASVDEAVAALPAGMAHGVAADITDAGTPELLVRTAMDTFGRLDGALISVGGPRLGSAFELTDDHWREAFETQFLGVVRTARTVAAALTGGGAIGFVLSTSTKVPLPGLGLSNGLRPGLAGVAKDLADELAPRGIRVLSLLPGRVLTDRNRQLFAATGNPEKAQAEATASVPLRRLGRPEEFGKVAAFALSPAASYLTGLQIPVDGGLLRTL